MTSPKHDCIQGSTTLKVAIYAEFIVELMLTKYPTAQLTLTPRCMQMHARMGLLEGYLPTTGKGLPWVPASGTSFLDGTAAADIDDAVMGRAWSSWEVALVNVPTALVLQIDAIDAMHTKSYASASGAQHVQT